ncbi:hypothetical protein K2173_023595 [Erythroxylum novogranatense]|uniref:DUF3741 domain-containing protein n=1 Tax=Erythroxylum novogranatense TaxID=1862640 RepID=A0AAV8TQG1_9ROSI|nr:hypothetical protein K2173_023595 [Erythroxylum novogranatense]
MYRSFFTCDESKGVVECAAIIKSKSGSKKMEPKIETLEKQRFPNRSLPCKSEKEKMLMLSKVDREEHSPSSFQLLGVFKENQKLDHVIDSWSRGLTYDGQFKDIEKELLKGTFDLQESLIMLGKLQKAPNYMAQLKTKQNGNEGRHTFRSTDQNYSIRLQRPHTSSDVSSRDFINEVRKAVRDNLAGENRSSNATSAEKPHLEERKKRAASTSSSQSSVFRSNSSESHFSFRLQTAQEVKGPNLIAKLMGLDYMPQTRLESEKNLRRERTVSDIEMQKKRKPQATIAKVESEKRSLTEVLESVQHKGLLKRRLIKELTSLSYHSIDFHSQYSSANDILPIVLIKPLPVVCLESEEEPASMPWEDIVLNTRILPATTKVQRRTSTQSDKGSLNFSKNDPEEHSGLVAKPNEKRVKSVNKKVRIVSANRNGKKLESDVYLTQRFIHDEGPKDPKAVARAKEKVGGTKLKASKKMKALIPPTDQQDGAEKTHTKIDKILKDISNKKIVEQTGIVKCRSTPRFRGQAKPTSIKQRKPEIGSVITKTETPQLQRKTPNAISRHIMRAGIHDCKYHKTKDKSLSEVKPAKQDTADSVCKGNAKTTDPTFCNDSFLEISNDTAADNLPKQSEANVLTIQTEEHCSDNRSSLCNFSLLNCDNDNYAISKYSKEADGHVDHIGNRTSFKKESRLKDLLMNNYSFLTQADELFHLNLGRCDVATTTTTKSGETEMRLYLDYANEFVGRRSLKDSQVRHPLLPSYVGGIRIPFTLDWLLDEVCDGVKTLESYCEPARCNLPSDDLFAILYRDLWWDLGWRNESSAMESELAVNDLEKLVVGELIEELFE